MPPTPLPKELTQDIQSRPEPLFGPLSTPEITPAGPLGMLQPGVQPPRSALERTMPPNLSFMQRLRAYGPGLVGSLVALGGRTPLQRMIGGPLAAGGTEKILGGEFLPEAGRFAATQGLAETGFAIPRFGMGQIKAHQALRAAETQFDQATQEHKAAVAQQRKEYQAALRQHAETVKKLQMTYQDAEAKRTQVVNEQNARHAQAQRDFAKKGAGSIADAYKETVPSWREFPSNETGLAEMVYGKGQEKVSQMYDAALKEVVAAGKGIQVPIRIEDVESLKLRPLGVIDAERGPTHAYVDAGELASALPGKWSDKRTRAAYNRGFDALDQQGLGNEKAREEYRSSRSLVQFTDQSGMLRGGGGGQFDPAAAKQALFKLKDVDTLRIRKAGDVFRGPIAEAAQAEAPIALPEPPKVPKPILPQKPLRPSPLTPPEKTKTGITKHEAPILAIPGLMAGAALGHATGIPHLTWTGAIAGEEVGRRLGPRVPLYTGGPSAKPTPPALPTALAELIRLYLTQPKVMSSQ